MDNNTENLKNIQKLAKMLDGHQMVTVEEFRSAVSDFINAFAQHRSAFGELSKKNEETLNTLLKNFQAEHDAFSTKATTDTEKTKKDISNQLKKAKQEILDFVKNIIPKDGKDGLDADEERVTNNVLAKIKLPEQKEVILDNGDQIVEKINEGKSQIKKEKVEGLEQAILNSAANAVNALPPTTMFVNGKRSKNLTITGATVSTQGDTTTVTIGSGTGTVTSVASADGSVTITNGTTTPDLAVVKAPKLSTARLIGGTSFDGTADITPALATTVTTNANLTGPITSVGNATTVANSINLPGSPTTTTQSPADNSTKIATTAYVDNAVLGQNFKEAVRVATTANLVGTYSNGANGVGATFTYTATGTDTIDGVTLALGDRVLLKNQTTDLQNGIYTVTTAGAVGVAGILTRATDADQTTDFKTGDSVFVTAGTTLTSTTWAYTGIDSPTMGTTSLTYVQVAGQGSFSGGNGINITGTSIAIDTSVTVDKTTSQTLTNKTLTSPTLTTPVLGTPSSGTLTNCTFPTLNQNTTGSAASLSISGQTGLLTFTGLASTSRIKTVRDAADTILELGGSYTPTGTWTSMTLVTPALGTPASGVVTNLTGTASININGTVGATTPTTGTFTLLTASKAGLSLDVTNSTDATSNQIAKFSGTNATRANNDLIYNSYFLANSAGTQKEFGRMNIKAPVVTNTSEDGSFIWSVMNAGTLTDTMTLTKNSLSIGTSNTFTTGTIELGAASDTTLSRSSAGVLAVEGVVVDTVSAANTLTNKTLTAPVINGLTSSGSTSNDFSGSTGTFLTSSGANTLSGATTIADATTPSLTTAAGKTNTGFVQVNGKTSGALKITTADATAQTLTFSVAAQTTGAATVSIPDMAGTSRTVVTAPSGGPVIISGPTAARTVTFPDAAFTAARTDAAQTFTGTQTFSQIVTTSNAITASGNAATVPITSRISTVTNNSAATLTITITTTSAVDGQLVQVRVLDFSAAVQTITWVNTENGEGTAPTTSNGSTTLPRAALFQFNSGTSKWRCIAS